MTAKDIFIGWMQRDFDFPLIEARKEFRRISQCETRDDYLRISRAGSFVKLDRTLRNCFYSAFENAHRHADTIEEMHLHLAKLRNKKVDL